MSAFYQYTMNHDPPRDTVMISNRWLRCRVVTPWWLRLVNRFRKKKTVRLEPMKLNMYNGVGQIWGS